MPPSRSYTPSNGLRDESHIHDLHHFLSPTKRTVRAALYNPSGPANTHGKAMLCCVTGSRPIRISWVVPSEPGESRTERLIENILCVLLSNPLEQLDIRHNGSLLEIFEAYRHQVDLIRELRQALSEGVSMQGIVDRTKSDKREKLNRVPEPTQQRSEGLCLPEHVDRPLACSVDDQLLPVTDDSTDPFARPSDHKETVFEFLEHSHALAEQGFGNQRATMRKFTSSPSRNLAAPLSWLKKKPSMVSIHDDLPFGSLPSSASEHQHLLQSDPPAHSVKKMGERCAPLITRLALAPLNSNADISSDPAADVKASKIPSPVYSSGARPRQRRRRSGSSIVSESHHGVMYPQGHLPSTLFRQGNFNPLRTYSRI